MRFFFFFFFLLKKKKLLFKKTCSNSKKKKIQMKIALSYKISISNPITHPSFSKIEKRSINSQQKIVIKKKKKKKNLFVEK